jgi:hypothetical protein
MPKGSYVTLPNNLTVFLKTYYLFIIKKMGFSPILRAASSENPGKMPILEVELVLREMFYENNLFSVTVAVEMLKSYNLQEANSLRNYFGNILLNRYAQSGDLEAAMQAKAKLGLSDRSTLIPLAVRLKLCINTVGAGNGQHF